MDIENTEHEVLGQANTRTLRRFSIILIKNHFIEQNCKEASEI